MIAEIRDDGSGGASLLHETNAAAAAAAALRRHHAHRPVHNDTDEFGNPARGDNYRQEFEAPFYPSVNLDKHPETIRNQWAVVTPPAETDATTAAKAAANKKAAGIDRSDSHDVADEEDENADDVVAKREMNAKKSENNQTKSTDAVRLDKTETVEPKIVAADKEKFNQAGFQPELQGGFRPIYPPGMKATSDLDDEEPKIEKVQPKSVDHHGTEDESIAALVYDGLGASISEEDITTISNSR